MPRRFADKSKDAYSPKSGGHGKGHPFGQGQHEKSVIAIKQKLGRQTGTGRKGFPHLPPEGDPRPSDMWRG